MEAMDREIENREYLSIYELSVYDEFVLYGCVRERKEGSE